MGLPATIAKVHSVVLVEPEASCLQRVSRNDVRDFLARATKLDRYPVFLLTSDIGADQSIPPQISTEDASGRGIWIFLGRSSPDDDDPNNFVYHCWRCGDMLNSKSPTITITSGKLFGSGYIPVTA